MFKLTAIAFIFSLIAGSSFTQNSNDTLQELKPEHYRQDFTILRKTLRKLIHLYTASKTKNKLTNFLTAAINLINHSTNEVTFYATVKFVLSFLEDGHLSSSPSPKLRNMFQEQWKYFPLSLIFLKDKVYNFCENNLIPKGAEILSINNISIQKIKDSLFQYIVSDGKIETSKNYVLNNAFWFYYNLVCGQQSAFEIEYKLLDGETKNTIMHPELRQQMQCNNYEPIKNERLLELTYPKQNVALLTIKTFSYQELTDLKNDFGVFLDTSFL
jgi:hypothetical protein